jgi:hypothetical protein
MYNKQSIGTLQYLLSAFKEDASYSSDLLFRAVAFCCCNKIPELIDL